MKKILAIMIGMVLCLTMITVPALAAEATEGFNKADYTVSYKLDYDNAVSWTGGDIGSISVEYFFRMEADALYVAIRGNRVPADSYIQLNFNPGNKLSQSTGLFLSFVTGDTFKLLQHNHKTGVLDDASPAGADISDKIEGTIVKTDKGYDITAKLPKEQFNITDVEGAENYDYTKDPLYFGMFLVAGGHGFTSQSVIPGENWVCDALRLTEYSISYRSGEITRYYFYDKKVRVNTGWWLNPLTEGAKIDVTFEVNASFYGFDFYAYGCPYDYPMVLVLMDEDENELWTSDITCKSNASYSVDMGRTFGPGIYILSFIGGDVDKVAGDKWFVLGSGQINEDIDEYSVTVAGGQTNGDTGNAPYISLIIDPNAATPVPTEKPTEKPTTEPPADATQAYAPVPTEAPATEVPTTDAPKSNETKSGPGAGLIIGIIAGVIVVAATVAGIVIASKKKKK